MIFKAATNDFMRIVDILAVVEGRPECVAKPVLFTLQEVKVGDYTEPTLSLKLAEAQSLMTALWEAGVRPHDYKNANGEIQRIEAHLQDMRQLVFGHLRLHTEAGHHTP